MLANQPELAKVIDNPSDVNDWSLLVAGVKLGEVSAMEDLYKLLKRGIRYYLFHQLGAKDLDDKVHDTFLIVVKAIRQGNLREPERLTGFVRTISRRQVAAYIQHNVKSRRDEDVEIAGRAVADPKNDPEKETLLRERTQLMKVALTRLSERDREILVRFYLHEQTQELICREMQLSDTQFRLLKSRAKTKLGYLGKKAMNPTEQIREPSACDFAPRSRPVV
jgi:RNA polymerase sigma-70 factor (ECF subfamily)